MTAGVGTLDVPGLERGLLANNAPDGALVGGRTQTGQTKTAMAACSSIFWPGAGVATNTAAQAAEVGNWIAIPVSIGATFNSIGAMGGSAAAATVAEYITALYVGEPGGALIAQSKSVTPGSHPKEELYVATLESQVIVTASMCPGGYLWAEVSAGAAGTMFSFYSLTYTAAGQEIMGKLSSKAPVAISCKGGAAIKTKAEAVVPTLTAVANVPIAVLF